MESGDVVLSGILGLTFCIVFLPVCIHHLYLLIREKTKNEKENQKEESKKAIKSGKSVKR